MFLVLLVFLLSRQRCGAMHLRQLLYAERHLRQYVQSAPGTLRETTNTHTHATHEEYTEAHTEFASDTRLMLLGDAREFECRTRCSRRFGSGLPKSSAARLVTFVKARPQSRRTMKHYVLTTFDERGNNQSARKAAPGAEHIPPRSHS